MNPTRLHPLPNNYSVTEKAQIFPYFQPIIGAANSKIVGYEALARRYDDTGGIISAGALFSDNNIHYEDRIHYDRHVRKQALKMSHLLPGNSHLAINISAVWLDYVDDIHSLPTIKMLDEFKINRNRIIVEITETGGNINRLVEIVRVYRKHGLKVAVDDFGAGFSQLERVLAIKPDFIKLDMRLFKKASKGGIAGDVVHLLSRLGSRNGCKIVCEGIESEADFFFGLRCGAQFMQGFLFSQATPEFSATDSHQKHITCLRTKFVHNAIAQEQNKLHTFNQLKELILILQQKLQSDFNLNELSQYPFEACGILRFYLCNNDGKQISSNFNFQKGKWFEDPKKIGFNWSWRPYLYKLLALEHTQATGSLVTSSRYRDFNSDRLCKTLSVRLDSDRILLVDINAD